MHEYEVTNLQIEQGWIQKKDVHPLYQLQVVSGDNDVRIAPTRPQKWATRSALTMQLSCKNRLIFCVFTHKAFSMCPYQGFTTLLLRSRCHKWIQNLPNPSKTL